MPLIERFTCGIVQDEHGRTLRINAYADRHDGVYVLVPLTEQEREADPIQRTNLLVADLQNALDTLLWLYREPEQALAAGMLTGIEAKAIRRMLEHPK